MRKSQLRRLAADYAQRQIDEDEYRRRRAWLIDGIVDGAIVIEREDEPEPGDRPPTIILAEPTWVDRLPRRWPLYAAGLGALLLLVVWALLPDGGPGPDTARSAAPAPSPAETLVQSFLRSNDWSAGSLSQFLLKWNSLDAQVRETARDGKAYLRLANAILQEVNARRALADLDGGSAPPRATARLLEFGRTLGMAERFPDFAPAAQEASLRVPAPPPEAGATRDAPPPASAAADASGRRWLQAQGADRYTLQLYAMSHLESVEKLLAAHPGSGLQVVSLGAAEPRYRVLYGSYASEDAAARAHAALPAELRGGGAPVVKSVGELRAALEAGTADWLDAQRRSSFTLQLFALSDEGNARKLLAAYPQLGLRLYPARDESFRYRILYGAWDTPDAAEQAFAHLPAALVKAAGRPVVKSIAELQDAAAAAAR